MSDDRIGNRRECDLPQTGIQFIGGAVPCEHAHGFGDDEIFIVDLRVETRAVLGKDLVRCVGQSQLDLHILDVREFRTKPFFNVQVVDCEDELVASNIDGTVDLFCIVSAQVVKGQMLQAEEVQYKSDGKAQHKHRRKQTPQENLAQLCRMLVVFDGGQRGFVVFPGFPRTVPTCGFLAVGVGSTAERIRLFLAVFFLIVRRQVLLLCLLFLFFLWLFFFRIKS